MASSEKAPRIEFEFEDREYEVELNMDREFRFVQLPMPDGRVLEIVNKRRTDAPDDEDICFRANVRIARWRQAALVRGSGGT